MPTCCRSPPWCWSEAPRAISSDGAACSWRPPARSPRLRCGAGGGPAPRRRFFRPPPTAGGRGRRSPLSSRPSGARAGVGLLLAAFVWVEARSRARMMPLALFKSRMFAGVNLLTLLLYAALGGAFFFLPFLLIQVHGFSATLAGAAFLPFTAIMAVLSRWSGGLIDRFGARLPLIIGPAIAAVGFVLLPTVGDNYVGMFLPMIVLGLGMAIPDAPLTTTVINAVPERPAG